MTKGHNQGKNREESPDAKDTNSKGENRHLKKSNSDNSPNLGRNANSDPSGDKKGRITFDIDIIVLGDKK